VLRVRQSFEVMDSGLLGSQAAASEFGTRGSWDHAVRAPAA
jgi:hypothetical protein